MSVVLVLLIVSLTIAIGFLIAFIWSVKTGQFDDAYTPAIRMLFEDKIDQTEVGKDNMSNNKQDTGNK